LVEAEKSAMQKLGVLTKDGQHSIAVETLSEAMEKILLWAGLAFATYLFVLLKVIRIFDVKHVDQVEGDGIPFASVEKLTGFNYENTNPILVLKTHYLPDETRRLCALRCNVKTGKPLTYFAPGKQYLLPNFSEKWAEFSQTEMSDKFGGINAGLNDLKKAAQDVKKISSNVAQSATSRAMRATTTLTELPGQFNK